MSTRIIFNCLQVPDTSDSNFAPFQTGCIKLSFLILFFKSQALIEVLLLSQKNSKNTVNIKMRSTCLKQDTLLIMSLWWLRSYRLHHVQCQYFNTLQSDLRNKSSWSFYFWLEPVFTLSCFNLHAAMFETRKHVFF